MARIKIKSASSNDPRRQKLLLEILSKNDIFATRIITIADGFVILTENETELDKIFKDSTDQELTSNQFTPLIPLELKAHRSVIIFKIEDLVYNNTEDEIYDELKAQNSWISGISSVTKFQRGRGLKITFSETTLAKKAQEKGLLLFSMRIPTYNIIQDKHHNITTCLRCYALEEHHTSSCPKPRDFKICSECGTEGHIWRECQGGQKRCINCGGGHSTMAMSCGKKKEIINNKRKEERDSPNTYSEAARKNFPNTTLSQPKIPTPDTHIKILQCMYHAHFENMINPGCYEKVVNEMFQANKLPTIKVPVAPQSSNIIAKLTEALEPTTSTTEQPQQPEHTEQEQQATQAETSQGKAMETEQSTSEREQVKCKKRGERKKSITRITGRDVGLKIFTTKSKGWAEKPLRKNTLLKGIEDKIIKWTYTDPTIKEKDIMERFVFGQIDLSDCFHLVDEDVFRKIKTGLIEERSPAPRPGKLRRDST